MPGRTCVIVNPAAGRGRGGRMLPAISNAFSRDGAGRVRVTSAPGEEATVAAAAVAEGTETIVVAGGDGTISNVANAILHSGIDVRLAVLPAGTGNDFAKIIGVARASPAEVASLCESAPARRIDTGRIESHYFINSCGFGFDVAVLERMARHRNLRGNALYVYTALEQLRGYGGFSAGVGSNGSKSPARHHLLLVIANTERFGGVFRVAPGASPVDGLLDAVSVLDARPMRRIRLLAAAIRGRHVRYPECVRATSSRFEVSFAEPPAYQTDGELRRAAQPTLTVLSCPASLSVVAAPHAFS